MQKFKTLFLFLCFSLIWGWNSGAYSQISEGGIPPSFAFSEAVTQQAGKYAPFVAEINFDVNELKKIDQRNALDNKPPRIGVIIPVNLTLENSGYWITLPNGQKIWQLRINAPEALALSLYYDKFYIPEGDKLFIYNADKTHIIGAYTNKTNIHGKEFSTELIAGDDIILEYVPGKNSQINSSEILKTVRSDVSEILKKGDAQENNKPNISITGINYGYNNLTIQYNGHMGHSGACEVNINCPEGADWQDEKKGVFKTIVNDGYYSWLCSGSVINNTNQDLDPLLLTACHCIDGTTATNLNQTQFYFHYEQPGCDNSELDIPETKTMIGATLLVQNLINGGSDGALLRMNQPIPQSYDVYYNGWDVTGTAATEGVGIHHPSGDVKKISTYTAPLTPDTWRSVEGTGATNAHWRVEWIETQNGYGVTEGGSSGSPIFNQDKLIVGTLSGGPGSETIHECNLPKYSLYGKLSYHYNGSASVSAHMKEYLDPANTGLTKLPGTYTGEMTVADFVADKTNVYVAETVLFKNESIGAETYEWTFDGGNPATATTKDVEVTYIQPGTYNVKLTINKGTDNEETKSVDNYITVSLKTDEKSEVIIIGDGEATSGYPLGMEEFQTFSSSIYTKEELGSSIITITELSWEATSSVDLTRTLTIYMKEVDEDLQSPSTWQDEITGATLVYHSPAIWTNIAGWNLIKLDIPFNYSGSKNLKVIVQATSSTNIGLISSDVKYSNAANKHMWWTSSSNTLPTNAGTVDNNRPNIKIKSTSILMPEKPTAIFALDPGVIYEEGFDGEDFPPEEWTIESPGVSTTGIWRQSNPQAGNFDQFDSRSKFSALVPYDIVNIIDTRLISGEIQVPEGALFEYYAGYGGYYGEAFLTFNVSIDGGTTWNQENYTGGVEDNSIDWEWRKQTVDLSKYYGQTVKFMFRYFGIGNLVGIDGIKLYKPSIGEPIEIYEGESISALNLSEGVVVESDWSFPGGTPETSKQENPIIQYKSAGVYDITLRVRNNIDEHETVLINAVTVSARLPEIDFDAVGGYISQESRSPFIPQNSSVTYTESIKNYPTSFEWKFEGGDIDSSVESPVTVNYAAKGKFDVTLNATNDAGTNEVIFNDYIQVGDKASIWNIPKGEEGKTVYQFSNNGGYVTGTNNADYYYFAEKFDAPTTPGEVSAVKINFMKVSDGNEDLSVGIYSMNASGYPGSLLTSAKLNVQDIVNGEYALVTFDKPASISNEFFVVVSAPQNTTLAITTSSDEVRKNSVFVYYDWWGIGFVTYWASLEEDLGARLNMNIVPDFTYGELEVDTAEVQLKDKGSEPVMVNVDANVAWNAVPSASWINITNVTETSFTVESSQNKSTYRKGYVYVSAAGITKTIEVEQSIASPLNPVAENQEDHNVKLEWSKDFAVSEDIFDDFESHEAFTIASGGSVGWEYIDGDNYSDTYGFNGIDFPNAYQPMSFIIFDPSQTTPSLVNNEDIVPHSGNKFLACFSSKYGALNDWIISPKLNFKGEFRISFWAKTYMDYGLERFRVMYSTSDESDFLPLSEGPYEEAPLTWTRFEYIVPEGTQYVAINCISNDVFILMIDDIFIGQGNAPATKPADISVGVMNMMLEKAGKSLKPKPQSFILPKKDVDPDTISEDIIKQALNNRPVIEGVVMDDALMKERNELILPRLKSDIIDNIQPKTTINQTPSTRLMKWHDGIAVGRVGNTGGDFEAAVRFSSTDLMPYLGYKLSEVEVVLASQADFRLKIYKNGEVIAYQPITDYQIGVSCKLTLRNPILLDETFEELMIAYEVSNYAATDYPAARDNSANVPDKGGLVKLNGTWYNLTDVGLSLGNWMMTGIVQKEREAIEIEYNIYRNGDYIGSTENAIYLDENVSDEGNVCYTVTALQSDLPEMESSHSEDACTILKHILRITAKDIERRYGTSNPDVADAYEITGFQEGDDEDILSQKPVVTINPFKYHSTLQTGTYENAVEVSGAEDNTNRYRFVYQYGSLIIKDMASDASLNEIIINGTSYTEIPQSYLLDCADTASEVSIEIQPNDNNATVELLTMNSSITISNNVISVRVNKAGIQQIAFAITAQDGRTKEQYSFNIEKYLVFDDVVVTRWGNTMTVINNPANNGGYKFTAYKWYRDGSQIGSSQSYSADSQLDNNARYYVEVTTTLGEVLRTCEASPNLRSMEVKAYPNPVSKNNTVYVEADLEEELLANAVIEVYNTSGIKVMTTKVTGKTTPITLQSSSGTYVFRLITKDGFSRQLKVIKE